MSNSSILNRVATLAAILVVSACAEPGDARAQVNGTSTSDAASASFQPTSNAPDWHSFQYEGP